MNSPIEYINTTEKIENKRKWENIFVLSLGNISFFFFYFCLTNVANCHKSFIVSENSIKRKKKKNDEKNFFDIQYSFQYTIQ